MLNDTISISQSKNLNHSAPYALILQELADAKRSLTLFDEVLSLYQMACNILKELFNTETVHSYKLEYESLYIQCQGNLARSYADGANRNCHKSIEILTTQALPYFEPRAETDPDSFLELAIAYNMLSGAYGGINEAKQQVNYAKKALVILDEKLRVRSTHELRLNVLIKLVNAASLSALAAPLEEMEYYFDEVRRHYTELYTSESFEWLVLDMNAALFYQHYKDYQKTEFYARRAIKIIEKYPELYPESNYYRQQVLEILNNIKDRIFIEDLLKESVKVLSDMKAGYFRQAKNTLEYLLAFDGSVYPLEKITLLSHLADVLLMQKKTEEAKIKLSEALKYSLLLIQNHLDYTPVLYIYYCLAKISIFEKNYDISYKYLQQGWEILHSNQYLFITDKAMILSPEDASIVVEDPTIKLIARNLGSQETLSIPYNLLFLYQLSNLFNTFKQNIAYNQTHAYLKEIETLASALPDTYANNLLLNQAFDNLEKCFHLSKNPVELLECQPKDKPLFAHSFPQTSSASHNQPFLSDVFHLLANIKLQLLRRGTHIIKEAKDINKKYYQYNWNGIILNQKLALHASLGSGDVYVFSKQIQSNGLGSLNISPNIIYNDTYIRQNCKKGNFYEQQAFHCQGEKTVLVYVPNLPTINWMHNISYGLIVLAVLAYGIKQLFQLWIEYDTLSDIPKEKPLSIAEANIKLSALYKRLKRIEHQFHECFPYPAIKEKKWADFILAEFNYQLDLVGNQRLIYESELNEINNNIEYFCQALYKEIRENNPAKCLTTRSCFLPLKKNMEKSSTRLETNFTTKRGSVPIPHREKYFIKF